jgi:hypothetical protein
VGSNEQSQYQASTGHKRQNFPMGNNLFKEVIVEDEAEIVGGPSDTNSQ